MAFKGFALAFLLTIWLNNASLGIAAATSCPAEKCTESKGIIGAPLKIGSWNAQKLGKTKMKKEEVVKYIVQVILRYDIIVFEEVIDTDQAIAKALLEKVNEAQLEKQEEEGEVNPNAKYNFVESERIGDNSTHYRELYLYFYRVDLVSVEHEVQYPDIHNYLQIQPFMVVFKSFFSRGTLEFGVIPIHTSPDEAVAEIGNLTLAYEYLVKVTGNENAIIIGDFNAGCTYVKDRDWPHISLWTDDRFVWLIDGHVDTTTKSTSCAYDRIVLAGKKLISSVYHETASVFYFDDAFDIAENTSLVRNISDHYPVELKIRGKVSSCIRKSKPNVAVNVDLVSTAKAVEEFKAAVDIAQDLSDLAPNCKPEVVLSTKDSVMIEVTCKKAEKAMESLNLFKGAFPCVVTPGAVTVLTSKIDGGVLNDNSLYGDHNGVEDGITITIFCIKKKCKIALETPTKYV